jgi:hypothetical protein
MSIAFQVLNIGDGIEVTGGISVNAVVVNNADDATPVNYTVGLSTSLNKHHRHSYRIPPYLHHGLLCHHSSLRRALEHLLPRSTDHLQRRWEPRFPNSRYILRSVLSRSRDRHFD